ncbi:MAG TPA: phosphatase PAP2 family protein [Anaerolineales bacterium]|nr:phosphatase PAP2 family protein [Anaerolineales bacterium]
MAGNKLDNRTSSDLRVPGWLARLPAIGLIMFLVGSLAFGALAYNEWTHGPLLRWDVPLTNELHSEAVKTPKSIIEFLIFGFFVGKELVQVLTVILILYFLHKRFWRELAMLVVGVGGGAVIWYFLMWIFHRPRPPVQFGIVVNDFSFPSGHVMTAVLFYGLLAYLLVPKMPSLFWKWVVVIAALLTILFVGFSRLFLGGHYLTDLLAGYALGIAWAGLVYTLIERLFTRRKMSRVK